MKAYEAIIIHEGFKDYTIKKIKGGTHIIHLIFNNWKFVLYTSDLTIDFKRQYQAIISEQAIYMPKKKESLGL